MPDLTGNTNNTGQITGNIVGTRGPKGETGDTGNGIASAVLNADYTLTLTWTNGDSYTTPSIRGAQGIQGETGVSITGVTLNSNYTLTITFSDGTSTTTDSIRGAKGEQGETGNGIASIAKTSSVGLIDTYTVTYTDGSTWTYNVTNGQNGTGSVADVWQNGVSVLDDDVAKITVPTKTSDLTNDSGYITGYTETDPTVPSWAKQANKPSYAYSEISNTPQLAVVATSGNYEDLSNLPTIPTVPTNVSDFTNDANYQNATQVATAVATKQDMLVSGTNIKTVNNTSLLGSGNITVSDAELENRVAVVETEQTVLDARMDTFSSLTDGSTTGDAELTDIRVSTDGATYPNAGGAVRGQISVLESVANELPYQLQTLYYAQGQLIGTTGAVDTSVNFRIVTSNLRHAQNDIAFVSKGNYRMYFCYYQSDGTFLRNSGWIPPGVNYVVPSDSYYRFQIALIDGVEDWRVPAVISTFAQNVTISPKLLNDTISNARQLSGIGTRIVSPELRNGSVSNAYNADAVATNYIVPFNGADSATICIDGDTSTGVEYEIYVTTYSVSNGRTLDNSGNRLTQDMNEKLDNGMFVLDQNYWRNDCKGFGFAIIKKVNGTTTPIRITDNDVSACIIYTYNATKDTVINESLQRRAVYVQQWGLIPKQQAFTIYNGYIYSIGNDSIAKSSLTGDPSTIIEEKTIDVGHGNSLQLGSNGVAYASGWDDNTVYVVNLGTMSVTSQIELPTTGYTTSAIDDKRGYAYIFQRDSYPDTETCYNFIVYDYVNEQIIKTAKTISFGAIQACDLYEDRIIVANGLGTSAVPNGIRVYSVDGNVISTYHINTITDELEGICFDSDSGVLYVSDVGNKIYTIKPAD